MENIESSFNKIRLVFCDYKIDPEKFYMILFDKNPAEGIFTKEKILLRLPEVLSWYEILDLFDKDYLKKNITKELISKKEAKQKEVSIDPIEISKLFRTFPAENLNSIKWIKSIYYNDFPLTY